MLLAGAKSRGINLDEFEELTLGQVIDMIIAYDNMHMNEEQDEEGSRLATQEDWDKF